MLNLQIKVHTREIESISSFFIKTQLHRREAFNDEQLSSSYLPVRLISVEASCGCRSEMAKLCRFRLNGLFPVSAPAAKYICEISCYDTLLFQVSRTRAKQQMERRQKRWLNRSTWRSKSRSRYGDIARFRSAQIEDYVGPRSDDRSG